MPESIPPRNKYMQKPAYQITCGTDTHPGCGKAGKFYFDRPLPTTCTNCGNAYLKVEGLQTGQGYTHKRRQY